MDFDEIRGEFGAKPGIICDTQVFLLPETASVLAIENWHSSRSRMKNQMFSALVAMSVLVAPALAEDPPPFAEFTFKRMAPPTSKTGPRITIQIEPEAPAAPTEIQPEVAAPPLPFAKFWAEISPRLEDMSSARLDAVLAALEVDPPEIDLRLDDVRKITDVHGRDILAATVGTRVSPALVAAVIAVESSGRVDATSVAGAQGLMQLMPDTAKRFGVADPLEPVDSIKGGVAYLDWLMGEFDRDPVLILAGYNAGEGAVRSHAGVPPFAETRAYVPKVLAAWRVASGLCRTPPMLISDGCVFVGPDG